MKSEF